MQAAAVAAVLTDRTLVGSALYVLAINHKHMAMYFAPAFFSYLLGRSLHARGRFGSWQPCVEVATLACVVIGTFLLVWGPFLTSPPVALKVCCWHHQAARAFLCTSACDVPSIECTASTAHCRTPAEACCSTRQTAIAGRRGT